MSWAIEPLRKYAVFSGRSRRKEYWYFFLFTLIVSIVLAIVDSLIGTMSSSGTGLLQGIFSLAILIPSVAVSIRRLHDIGRTGWWFLIVLVPIVGTIVLLIFAVLDSESGSNQYGANPKTAVA